MTKLEEEKKEGEIEEEEKFSESVSSQNEEEDQQSNLICLTVDQIAFNLTKALIFTQSERWETYKSHFLKIILCTLAQQKDEKQIESHGQIKH